MDGDDTSEQQDNDPARKDHLGGGDEADGLQQGDDDHMDSYSPAYNGNKRERESRRSQSKNTVNNDGIAREDVSHVSSEVADDSHPDREIGVPQEERYMNVSTFYYQFQMDMYLYPISSDLTLIMDLALA